MCRKKLHSDDSGVAMIMALIVGVVVMAFCLSLLLVSYSLFAQTNRKNTGLQCKLLAQSCGEMLEAELTDENSDMTKYLQYKMQEESSAYGAWIAENETTERIEELQGKGLFTYEDLQLEIDASGYEIHLFISYKHGAGDDVGDTGEEGNGPDDEVEDGDAEAGIQETVNEGNTAKQAKSATEKRRVKITIQCIRGVASDRDKQVYTLEEEYVISVSD